MIFTILFLFLLTACEQEREDDTRFLHPYSGNMPVIFTYLHHGATSVEVEAQTTLPYYSQEAGADLLELTGFLFASGEPIGALTPIEEGKYSIDFEAALSNDFDYYLSLEHPEFDTFRTSEVTIPEPVRIAGIDTVRRGVDIYITGNFGSVDPGLSVSSKLLRFGEGQILNSDNGKRLPVAHAALPQNAGMNQTTEYRFRNEFVVFDQETLTPADTVVIDSVLLVLYTWGAEVSQFNESIAGVNQEFGDGGESIDNTTWSNVESGHGMIAGFSTDTITLRLR